jgi:ATP-dependent Clp protease adaptor protein ClpS
MCFLHILILKVKKMTSQTDTLIKPQISPKLDIKEPGKYKVIYINDETTTMEFVILSLISIFNFSEPEAHNITTKIHEDGSAVVAVLPYEIAEQKGIEVTMLARSHGFPLAIKLEQE